MDAKDTTKAVEAASKAFKTWQFKTSKERSDLLRKWFNLCVANSEELARLLTAEQGESLEIIITIIITQSDHYRETLNRGERRDRLWKLLP